MDVFEMVTNKIISELENGLIPWHKPWSMSCGAISRVSGKPYSLLNQILLSMARPDATGEWVTFKQANEEGGFVKKGEKGTQVVFWKPLEVKDKDTDEVKTIFYLRYYTVFHISQCEGLKPKYAISVETTNPEPPDIQAEKIIADYVARSGVSFVRHKSNEAYYSPALDKIVVPEFTQFNSAPEAYSTYFHEMAHSTGSPNRLNRITAPASFGSESYSKEELVAELSAAFLLNHTGLDSNAAFINNAAYIQSWLKELKNDKRLIVIAAGKAEKAVKYILGEHTTEPDPSSDQVQSV